jgi:hypothetical protein
MSAFYDQASLVVVPSGYKSGKIYAQKPLTTDGQLTFTRASTATRVNASGLIESVASGVPRLDYLNSTCPRLLLEPQRSSLVLYSEQLNNAAWIKQTVTISANSSVSPDGYSNADKVAIDNGASGGYVYQSIATTSSTVYTTSFFVKAAGINFTKFYSNVTGSYVTAVINLTTGAITNSGFATTPTATNYGNGWWRVSYTETSGGGSVPIYVDGGTTSNGGGITGNGTDGILIWGAQLEAGAYATSYIPTLGTSVTRVADAASKTGISSLIGQTEGTLFFEGSASDLATFKRVAISSGSFSSSVYLDFRNDGSVVASSWASGGLVLYQPVTPSNPRNRNKYAIAYKSNDWAVYVNGTLAAAQSSGAATFSSTLNTLEFALGGNDPFTGNVNQVLLFKTRLTNAQLAELTTL